MSIGSARAPWGRYIYARVSQTPEFPDLGLTWKVGAVHTTLARGAGIIGAAVALTAAFGTGLAVASNEYVGQTYNDAANAIASSGQTPVIASRFGTFLPTGACIVSSSSTSSSLDFSGVRQSGKVNLHLNCNNTFAAPNAPGNSVGSEAGRTARAAAEQAAAEQQAKLKAEGEAEAAEQKDLPEGG